MYNNSRFHIEAGKLSPAEYRQHKQHKESMQLQADLAKKARRMSWIQWVVNIIIAATAVFGVLNSVFGWFTIP